MDALSYWDVSIRFPYYSFLIPDEKCTSGRNQRAPAGKGPVEFRCASYQREEHCVYSGLKPA
jgi:hypothetical protein